jgi:hypothetical protein
VIGEAVLVVIDPHRTVCAFSDVEHLVELRRAPAGEHVHLVVAVEVHLVSAIADLLVLPQVRGDTTLIASCAYESREPDIMRDKKGGRGVPPPEVTLSLSELSGVEFSSIFGVPYPVRKLTQTACVLLSERKRPADHTTSKLLLRACYCELIEQASSSCRGPVSARISP